MGNPDVPRLDLDKALPARLADACRVLATWTQIAPEAVVTCVLAYCSACIGNSVWVLARGRRVPLSLHFVTSILSGSGKSEIRRYLASCIVEIQRQIAERREGAAKEAEDFELALAAWKKSKASPSDKKRDSTGDRPAPPKLTPDGGPRVTFTLDESTQEGLLDTLRDTPRGVLLATDEADTVVSMLGAYGDSGGGRRALDAARLRKLTESQPIEAHRAKSNAAPVRSVRKPFLALDVDVQPGIFAELFTSADKVSGTVARLLQHEPEPLQGTRKYVEPPPEPDKDLWAWFSNLFLDLWSISLVLDVQGVPEPADLTLSAGAERAWAEEMELLESEYSGASETMGGILGHARGRLLRLAGVLTLVRDRDAEYVEEIDMQRAIVLMRYFLAHARRLYAGVSRAWTAKARELVEHVQANPRCTASDLAQGGLRRYRGRPEEAARDLDALSGEGGPLIRAPGPRTVRYSAREGWRGMSFGLDNAARGGSDAKPPEPDQEAHPFGRDEYHPFGPPLAGEGGAPWKPL